MWSLTLGKLTDMTDEERYYRKTAKLQPASYMMQVVTNEITKKVGCK